MMVGFEDVITGIASEPQRQSAFVARHQADTIGLEGVEGIGDFAEAPLDIGQRRRGEKAEPRWMITYELWAYSLQLRATRRVVCTSPNQMPGSVIDTTAASMPC
jgi:hypothetical protein